MTRACVGPCIKPQSQYLFIFKNN